MSVVDMPACVSRVLVTLSCTQLVNNRYVVPIAYSTSDGFLYVAPITAAVYFRYIFSIRRLSNKTPSIVGQDCHNPTRAPVRMGTLRRASAAHGHIPAGLWCAWARMLRSHCDAHGCTLGAFRRAWARSGRILAHNGTLWAQSGAHGISSGGL